MMLFMAYCVLIAALLILACHAGEKCLLAFGRPTRFVWLAGIALSVCLPMAGIGRSSITALPKSNSAGAAIAADGTASVQHVPTFSSAASLIETVAQALRPFDRALVLAWAAASLLLLLGVLILAIRVRRMVRFSSTVAMAGTEVRVTRRIGPALVGLFKYDIVVPQWVLGLSHGQQSLIVAHEREHAGAFDPALVLLGALAVVAYPWNVSIWYLGRRLRTSIEMDCDRRVLVKTSDPHAYGSLLLDVGARTSSRPFFAAALSESASQLHMRISAMSSVRQPLNRMRTAGLAAAAIVLLGAAFRAPRPEAPPLGALKARGGNAVRLESGSITDAAKQNIAMVAIESRSQSRVNVIVFATRSARVARGELTPGIKTDTLRLRTPTTVMADLTDGEVHIVSVDGSAIDVIAIFRDSPAIKAAGHDAHVVLKQGGIGIGGVADGARAGDPAYFEFQVDKPVVQTPGAGAPAYPASLRASRVEGEVQAQFVVNKDGQGEAGTFKVLKATNDLFAEAVRSAFPNMRFSAAEIRGRKVRQIVHQSFQFRLDASPR